MLRDGIHSSYDPNAHVTKRRSDASDHGNDTLSRRSLPLADRDGSRPRALVSRVDAVLRLSEALLERQRTTHAAQTTQNRQAAAESAKSDAADTHGSHKQKIALVGLDPTTFGL
ncbi:hypothetical protein Pcac1_g23598 [Phytophthora cactorum]|nr:hypothetical protein Pcac1_g23598 [Phytophthora cactorum]